MSKKERTVRYARKVVAASCLMVFRGRSILTKVVNISASGILLEKPKKSDIDRFEIGSNCILEIVSGQVPTFHLAAQVVRKEPERVALHFTEIPEEKQKALWQLLGDKANETESY